MTFKKRPVFFLMLLLTGGISCAAQQVLSLPEAVAIGVKSYGAVRAKESYAKASREAVSLARTSYLPNFNIAAQQDYGTVNGQYGPLYGFNGLSAGSAGPALPSQRWTASFGSLYLANINWDFFAFGRSKEKIASAKAAALRDRNDWQQEIFQQKVRVAAAYLNLLAAQRLTESYRKNLIRADTFRHVVVTRALNGLIAGVDSSQANAEVSNARIALLKALDVEQEQRALLVQLMGTELRSFLLDTLFISHIPSIPGDTAQLQDHPLLRWYGSRIAASKVQSRYYKTLRYPVLSLVGVIQTRGSGFGEGYGQDLSDYTHHYWDAISPSRTNYLFGVGLTWNLTQPFRVSRQIRYQDFIGEGLQDEYEQARQELETRLRLADEKIRNAMDKYREVPVEVKAASDAFIQKSVLYKNGLTTLVDVTQALYVLTRAETDRDIAYSNVWQALLLKAAAMGDFNIFIQAL
ncbi:TolC family protein [Compostibacter hankyongensis]